MPIMGVQLRKQLGGNTIDPFICSVQTVWALTKECRNPTVITGTNTWAWLRIINSEMRIQEAEVGLKNLHFQQVSRWFWCFENHWLTFKGMLIISWNKQIGGQWFPVAYGSLRSLRAESLSNLLSWNLWVLLLIQRLVPSWSQDG